MIVATAAFPDRWVFLAAERTSSGAPWDPQWSQVLPGSGGPVLACPWLLVPSQVALVDETVLTGQFKPNTSWCCPVMHTKCTHLVSRKPVRAVTSPVTQGQVDCSPSEQMSTWQCLPGSLCRCPSLSERFLCLCSMSILGSILGSSLECFLRTILPRWSVLCYSSATPCGLLLLSFLVLSSFPAPWVLCHKCTSCETLTSTVTLNKYSSLC